MSNIVRYKGESNRGPSPGLWGDLSKLEDDFRMGKCAFEFEDFDKWGTHTVNTNATIISNGAWGVLADAGVTVNPPTTVDLSVGERGVLVVDAADADNDEAYVYRKYEGYKPDATYGYRIYFEARVKKAAIANDTGSVLVGLVSVADVAAALMADNTGELVATADFLGFHQLVDDGNGVDFVWQKGSQTKQILLANAAAFVADTYIKLGFLYNPNDGAGKCVRIYVDGVESSTTGTLTNVTAATFPDDVTLAPIFGYKINGTVEVDAYVDWIAAAQYYE